MPLFAPAPSSAIRSTQRLLKKLYRDATDATICVLSDSTGAQPGAWVELLTASLAARYPTYTVKYAKWVDGSMSYPTPTVIQTGSGANTLWVWNAAVGGKDVYYFTTHLYEMVGVNLPDLTIINLGHNEVGTGITEQAGRDRMLALTESVMVVAPFTSLIITAQNERTDGVNPGYQVAQLGQYANICALRGYGYLDVWQAFHDYPGGAASIEVDGVHPNTGVGYPLWNTVALRAFVYLPDEPLLTQPVSTFLEPGAANLVENGSFDSFSSPPTLTGWTATGVTLSKDTSNYESARHGYAVRGVATGASQSYMTQIIGGVSASPNKLNALLGRWVTVAARLRVASATATLTAGRVAITASGGSQSASSVTAAGAQHYDRFWWSVVSLYIYPDRTGVTIWFYFDSAANTNADVTVDRIIVVPGILPRDIVGINEATTVPAVPTTFTPDLTFATPGDLAKTLSGFVGTYVRVNSMVFFTIRVTTSAFTWSTASGDLRITGLPFPAATSDIVCAATMRGYTDATRPQVQGQIQVGNSYLNILSSGSGTTSNRLTATQVPSGGTVDIFASGFYLV